MARPPRRPSVAVPEPARADPTAPTTALRNRRAVPKTALRDGGRRTRCIACAYGDGQAGDVCEVAAEGLYGDERVPGATFDAGPEAGAEASRGDDALERVVVGTGVVLGTGVAVGTCVAAASRALIAIDI